MGLYFLFVRDLAARSLAEYRDHIHTIFLLASLVLLMWLAGWARPEETADNAEPKPSASPKWLFGLLAVLLFTLLLMYYTNPHARFSTANYPFTTPGARLSKTQLYGSLAQVPDIVILGSSRAFTLSPEYIQETLGYSAFNFSVEGGRAGDFLTQLNFIMDRDAEPRLLLVEVSVESLGTNFSQIALQPSALARYLPLRETGSLLRDIIEDTFNAYSMADMIYLLTRPPFQPTWTFDELGGGYRKELTQEQYMQLLAESIRDRVPGTRCTGFNTGAQSTLEQFLATSQEHGIQVVLYASPMHSEFYTAAFEANPEAFQHCRDLVSNYLSSLTSKYTNVDFEDLSGYEPINSMAQDGFYDAVHLNQRAADILIDTLAETITSALSK